MADFLLWMWDNIEKLKDFGLFASAVMGAVVAPVAFLKLRAQRLARQELIAKDLYKSYLQLAMQHPKFAYPANVDIDYARGEIGGSKELFESYEWYVSYVLMTASEILQLDARSINWKELMRLQLWYHKRYFDVFDEKNRPYLKPHRKELKSLIDSVRADKSLPGHAPTGVAVVPNNMQTISPATGGANKAA